MKKPRRIVRKLLLLFIFILPLTAFLAYRYTRTIETILPFILSKATSQGINLQIEKMSGPIITGIKADSISLFFPESNLTIKASKVEADFSIWDIIKGNLGFSNVRIEDAEVTIASSSNTKSDTAKSGGFPVFPHLILNRIDIDNFRVNLPGNIVIQGDHLGGDAFADSLEIFLDLEADGTEVLPYTGKIEKILIEANGNGGEYDITRLQLQSKSDLIGTKGSVIFPVGEAAIFSLNLEARINNLNRWLAGKNQTPFLENATADMDISFEGSYKDFYAPVKIAHTNSTNLNIEEGTVNIFYSSDEWFLDHLVLNTNFGYIEGTFGYSRDNNLYALANMKDVYLDSTQTGEKTISFDAWLNVAMTKIRLKELTGSAALILNDVGWGQFKAKQFNFYAEAEDGLITILDNSKVTISDESAIILDGTLNNKNEVDFSAFAHENQLMDYSEPLSGVPIEGIFTGFISITGQLDNPSFFADVQVDTFKHEYFSLDNVSLQANILDIVDRRRGHVNLLSYGGEILERPVQMAKVDMFIENNIIIVKEAEIKDQHRHFDIRGTVDLAKGEARIDSLFAKYDFYEFNSTTPFDFSWSNDIFSGSSFKFTDNYGGLLQATKWTYPLTEQKTLININDLDLGRITKLFGDQYSFGGNFSAIIEGYQQENTGGPFLNGLIIADGLEYGGFDIDQLTIRGQFDSSGINLPEMNISGENFSLKSSGKWTSASEEGKPQSLKINWDNFPIQSISYFVPFFEETKGTVNGEMKFGGSLEFPQIDFNLDIENAAYGNTHYGSVKLNSRYADSLFTVYNSFFIFKGDTGFVSVSVPLRLNFANPEKIELRNPLSFNTHADFKNKKLSTRFVPYLEGIQGDIRWNINGTLIDSTLLFRPGFVHFENAEIDVTELKNKIFDASGDLRFDSSYIRLENFSGFTERKHSGFNWLLNAVQSLFTRGEINRGELTGSGLISLENINKPKVDLGFQGTNIYLEYLPVNLKATADINDFKIVIDDEVNISGDIDLQYADLAVEPNLANKLSYLYGSTGIDKGKNTQNVNLNIYIPGNATIHSEGFKLINNFKIEILGELRIFQGKNTGIIGSLEMIDGSIYYIKNFDIQYGQLNFLSPNQIDTRIDLIATRTEKGKYIIQFVLKGSLDNLQYELIVRDVQNNQVIPMAEKDVITLLTLGMETQEYASDSLLVTGSDLLTEATGKALEGLARKYNFADKVEFQSKVYNPNTAGTSSIFTYGKYLTNDLYVEYQGRLSQLDVSGAYIPMPSFTWQAGNQVGIRYRINRSWSLNTTMLRTFENNNKYRIDLKWKKEF